MHSLGQIGAPPCLHACETVCFCVDKFQLSLHLQMHGSCLPSGLPLSLLSLTTQPCECPSRCRIITCHSLPSPRPRFKTSWLVPGALFDRSPVWLRQGPFEGRLRLILPPRSASASSVYQLAQVRLEVTLPVGEMSRQEESIRTASVDTHALWNTCERHKSSPSPSCAVLKIPN